MARLALLPYVLLLMVFALAAGAAPVTLTAEDGVKVFGEFWPAANAKAPLILTFHQAGSSLAEYAPLAARLNKAGFSVLAIDQRSGGDEFGDNKTVAALGRSTTYDAALPDLEAALEWARTKTQGTPLLVWGSSYSAALVFLLAAKHPGDIQGLLAFSPGEYLGTRGVVHKAAQSVRVPVFVTQSSDKDEIATSRAIIGVVPGSNKTLFVAKQGVHGSSTLRADRNAAGAEQNWAAVLVFLSQFRK